MNWRSLIGFLCVLLLITCNLPAQEEHGTDPPVQETTAGAEQALDTHGESVDTGHGSVDTSHGESEGDPNIFEGGWGNVILTLSVFLVLLAVLGKWAWGPILAGLQKREEHIRQSIEEAEKARAEG